MGDGGVSGTVINGFMELRFPGFWLQRSGCFKGLKVKNPAENMWTPCCRDLRWSGDEEVAVEATAQKGSLLRSSFTEQDLIFSACLVTEKGKWILNSPCSFVLASL